MKHRRTLAALVAGAIAMLGIAYASVPLYRLFCTATGYGGTPQRVDVALVQPRERWITVSFDSNVDPGLPWTFTPDIPHVRVKLGEIVNVSYHAHNRGAVPLVGTAAFNVQPDKIGSYFDKIQCFCFSRQLLEAGQTVQLPVQFYIDPKLADDPQADDVTAITLSYTFFRAKDQSTESGHLEKRL